MKFPSKTSIIQFIKFGIIGVSNTLVSLAVYYVFLFIDKRLYMVGNVLGWVVSVANAFFWNNRYVFKESDEPLFKKILKMYLNYGFTFLLATALLYIEVDVLSLSPVISPILNLAITIPINFLLNKFWTFSGKKKG